MLGATLTQGWPAVALAYGAVQGPMWAGLLRGRAELHKFLLSPLVAAPLTVAAGIGTAALDPLLAGLSASVHGMGEFAIGAAVSVALGYGGGRFMSRGAPDEVGYQRGAVVEERPSSLSRKRPTRSRAPDVTLANEPVPTGDENKHFKLIGTTGTGKSTAISEILQGALARGDRAIIADPDGGYAQRFYDPDRGDVILNPFDGRSRRWDLFAEIHDAYDVEQLSRSLIPDHDGGDRSWRGYARTFFSAVTRQCRDSGLCDVAELYRLLVVADAKELRALLRGTPAQPFLEEHNVRMFDSIRSVTVSAVGALDYVAQQGGPGLSIRSWIAREERGVLFMPYKAGQIAALGSTISAWMRLGIFETMDRDTEASASSAPRGRKLWFVVDELDALGPIDGLKDALARLRKFDGRCVLGFQSIAQVSATYGAGDAHTIVENCGNTLILRCSASEGGGTARFASQLIGEREILRSTLSTTHRAGDWAASISRSQHFNLESAVLPAQIEQLPDLAGYLKFASDAGWRRVKLEAGRSAGESRSSASGRSVVAAERANRGISRSAAPARGDAMDDGMSHD